MPTRDRVVTLEGLVRNRTIREMAERDASRLHLPMAIVDKERLTGEEVRVRRVVGRVEARLPEHLRRLEVEPPYPVTIAPALRDLATAVDRYTSRR